jgi:hypothetical protein
MVGDADIPVTLQNSSSRRPATSSGDEWKCCSDQAEEPCRIQQSRPRGRPGLLEFRATQESAES